MIILLFLAYSISVLIFDRSEVTYNLKYQNLTYQYAIIIPLSDIFKDKTNIKLNQSNIGNGFKNYLKLSSINEILLKQIDLKRYFVFKKHFWVIIDNFLYLKNNDRRFGNLIDRMFIVTFNSESLEFCDLELGEINSVVVLNEVSHSDCLKAPLRHQCINECIQKTGHNVSSSKYFYNSTDELVIYLDDEDQNIAKSEQECLKACPDATCRLVYFSPKVLEKGTILKARHLINDFEFYFKSLSLTFLILGISFHQFVLKFAKFAKFKKLNIAKINFQKYIILSIELIIYFGLNLKIITDYVDIRYNPLVKRISVNLLKSNLSIAVCIYLNLANKDLEKNYNKTLLELEKASALQPDKLIQEVHMTTLGNKVEVKWYLTPKVIFRGFQRCFQFELFINEEYYRSILMPDSKLMIKYKNKLAHYIYIWPGNKKLNSESFQLDEEEFIKKIKIRSKSNRKLRCLDYNLIYGMDKLSFLDKCYNKETIKKFGKVDEVSLKDKDDFSKDEWQNLHAIRLNESIRNELMRTCNEKYRNEDCYSEYFEKANNVQKYHKNDRKVISIYYDVIATAEEDTYFYILLIDLLNIQSIFFNQNICKLLLILSFYLNNGSNCKLKKIKFAIIYLVCSIGFAYHFFFVLNDILNGELINHQFFKLRNSARAEEIIICLPFKLLQLINPETKFDPNHQTTYSYLNNITENVDVNTFFEKISYLTKSNRWKTLNSKTKFSDESLKIETFYFLKNKCFQISLDVVYHSDQFYFEVDNRILKIFIKHPFQKFYLMFKKRNKMQFSESIYMDIYSRSFLISYEPSSNEFNIIDNPFSFYFNKPKNVDEYLTKLIRKFKLDYKLQTHNFPIRKPDTLVIDDQLFEQYFKQTETSTVIYEGQFVTIFVKEIRQSPGERKQISFSLIFYEKVTVVRSKVNKASIILNIFSILSIWINFRILDLYIYIANVKLIFKLIYKILLKIRRCSLREFRSDSD